MIADPDSLLIQEWRDRIPDRYRKPRDRRPLGALGYLANGPAFDGMIEIEKLVLVVLYDEPNRGLCPLRLAGLSGRPVAWGVRWGGPEGSKFFKDLRLQPLPHARGQRVDTRDTDLLQLGLRLEHQLQRNLGNRWLPVQRCPQLPKLWAGFRRSESIAIQGDGPELASVARRRRESAEQVLESSKREYHGLLLSPLEWVSHLWQQSVTILADISRFPKRQVFSLKEFPADLQGYRAAAEFDFYGSKFRSGGRRRRRRRHTPVAAALAEAR